MDLKVQAQDITLQGTTWDVEVKDGIVPIISGNEEDLQEATLACFLELGSIPQLPERGVPWTDFLTNNITFGELDSYIRESITDSGKTEFYPEYQIVDDALTLTVGKGA